MKTTPVVNEQQDTEVASDARLNVTEIAALWTTYSEYSMMTCIYKHCLNNVEDNDIRSVLEFALGIANKRLSWIMETFSKEGLPIPIGYTDEDVNLKAPRLFSDPFYLYFIKNKTKIALAINSLALTTSARPDVRGFYEHVCSSTIQLFQKTADLLLKKGLYIRPPYITTPKTTDYIKKQNFLAGYLGKQRPLLAMEISTLFYIVLVTNFGRGILIGFRQVAKLKQVRDYMDRGINLASKHIDMFTSSLKQEDIPISVDWDTFVTDSTISPFSDKLMMALTFYMNAAGISNCNAGITTNLRHDLFTDYARTMADIANYSEDGVNIMIENGWFEEPPRVVDRRDLVNAKH